MTAALPFILLSLTLPSLVELHIGFLESELTLDSGFINVSVGVLGDSFSLSRDVQLDLLVNLTNHRNTGGYQVKSSQWRI